MPRTQPFGTMAYVGLNESPSEKEGKSLITCSLIRSGVLCLNESPSEKEGKLVRMTALILDAVRPQ